MAKPENRRTAPPIPNQHTPGDRATVDEERYSQEQTLSHIKNEFESTQQVEMARQRRVVEEDREAGWKTAMPGEVTPEQKYASHVNTVDFIQNEMLLAEAENPGPPRSIQQGIDLESIELIKREFAKANKRIVLPHG